jgi:ADP-heptose:LPS heptosyltransferase
VRKSDSEYRSGTSDKASQARYLLSLGSLDQALSIAEEVLAENERSADAHSLIGSILDRRGEWQASLAHLRRANELMPQGPQVRLNLAMALLRLGDYREGLPLYEARLDKPTWSGFATPESRAALRHRLLRSREPVEGRRILLLAEQGLGDGIMCARYIPLLARRGARITVASSPTLRPFFARIPGIETLLSPPLDQPSAQINLTALPFDAWLPVLSLPHWFGTDLATVPADGPYWSADATRIAEWRSRLSAAGRPGTAKIGLVFQANPDGAGFSDKSMQVGDIAPLLALDGIDIVNLQYGAAGRTLAAAAAGIIDLVEASLPLDEYGAALAATDLLITVDTMAAHLSGALGHAAWVAVPYSPHWVWSLDGETTPWYPTARIFRQQSHQDWSKPIAALASALRERFGASISTQQGVDARDQASPRSNPRAHRSRRAPSARTDFIATDDEDFPRREAARLELGLAQLRRGQWEEGFANHEARQNLPLWSEQALPLRESLAAVRGRQLQPGDPLDQRRIVVFTEQGLGDTFFGARFLGMLAERGAAVTLICRAAMRPFFARLKFLDAVLSPPEDAPHAKIDLRRLSFDAFCPLLSLPHVLGVASADTLPRVPYLSADQIEAWRARYQRLGRAGYWKVGVVWQANASIRFLTRRSMRAQDLTPLARLEGVDLVNLQSSPEGRELARVAANAIDPLQAPLTLDEFAAALAATDVVVSVDTMAAHCAGALGHPVLVMLTDMPAWYWGAEGHDCRWYPSARHQRHRRDHRSRRRQWRQRRRRRGPSLRVASRHRSAADHLRRADDARPSRGYRRRADRHRRPSCTHHGPSAQLHGWKLRPRGGRFSYHSDRCDRTAGPAVAAGAAAQSVRRISTNEMHGSAGDGEEPRLNLLRKPVSRRAGHSSTNRSATAAQSAWDSSDARRPCDHSRMH